MPSLPETELKPLPPIRMEGDACWHSPEGGDACSPIRLETISSHVCIVRLEKEDTMSGTSKAGVVIAVLAHEDDVAGAKADVSAVGDRGLDQACSVGWIVVPH